MADNGPRRLRYTDGETFLTITVPWGDGTGWIPPGHIDFQMTATHEFRTFVFDGYGTKPAAGSGEEGQASVGAIYLMLVSLLIVALAYAAHR